MLDSHPTLFDGTLEENITLQRPSIRFDDLSWALRFVELEEEVDALPQGLEAPVHGNGANFTRSQILRVLLATDDRHPSRNCWSLTAAFTISSRAFG